MLLQRYVDAGMKHFRGVDQAGEGRSGRDRSAGKKYKYRKGETRGIDSLSLERRRRRCRNLRTSFSPVILRKIAFAT